MLMEKQKTIAMQCAGFTEGQQCAYPTHRVLFVYVKSCALAKEITSSDRKYDVITYQTLC